MNVLSLFDGMSCGRIALDRAGIPVSKYYASEIDPHAIAVAQANYPDTVQLGSVEYWFEWDIDFSEIDLLIGGSPCQGFSFAGKQLAFDDPRSQLFFEYVNVLNFIRKRNPNVKFMLENVRMKKEHLDIITEYLDVEPVFINSALVSAQNRQRFYWCNWEVGQPEDRGIFFQDILEQPADAVGRTVGRRVCPETGKRKDHDKTIRARQRFEPRTDGKVGCLTTVAKDNTARIPKAPALTATYYKGDGEATRQRNFKKSQRPIAWIDDETTRHLTPLECERLQTVPEGYTDHVSKTQRLRMLGNGWTVDVIKHIFEAMPK